MFAQNPDLLAFHEIVDADRAWYTQFKFDHTFEGQSHRPNDEAMQRFMSFMTESHDSMARQAVMEAPTNTNFVLVAVAVEAGDRKQAIDMSVKSTAGGLAMIGWSLGLLKDQVMPYSAHTMNIQEYFEYGSQRPIEHPQHDSLQSVGEAVKRHMIDSLLLPHLTQPADQADPRRSMNLPGSSQYIQEAGPTDDTYPEGLARSAA